MENELLAHSTHTSAFEKAILVEPGPIWKMEIAQMLYFTHQV